MYHTERDSGTAMTVNTEYDLYDSVEDMLTDTSTIPASRCGSHFLPMKKWLGRDLKTWDQVEVAARSAWDDGLAIVDRMLADLNDTEMPRPKSRKRRTRFSEDNGDELDYDRLRDGRDYWRTSRRENTHGPSTITIVVNVGANCKTKAGDILWRGAAAIALATRLEEAGYRVEIWAGWRSDNLRSTKQNPQCKQDYDVTGVAAICLKRPDDPVDPSTLVAAVSGWFFRTVFFKATCVGEKVVKQCLGYARPFTPADLDEITPDQNRVCINDAFTYSAAVAEVRGVLSQLSERA